MMNRYQNIFRSRWKALTWAAGVLLTAYCAVPAPQEQARTTAHHAHVNPWALDKTAWH